MSDFFANVDTTGIEELIYSFAKMISEFDIKTLNFDYLGELLTVIAPVWNPIWAAINEWLFANFGF